MSDAWVRPYTPGTGRWLVIGWEAAAMGLLAWTTIQQFDLTGHGVRIVACVLAAVWVVATGRILQMGAYVGPDGLLIRGLVRSRKAGRVRTYRLTPKPLKEAEVWMTRQRAIWERRLDQLRGLVERAGVADRPGVDYVVDRGKAPLDHRRFVADDHAEANRS